MKLLLVFMKEDELGGTSDREKTNIGFKLTRESLSGKMKFEGSEW